MDAVLDHVFIMCDPGAAGAAAAVSRIGLEEMSSNTHPGQGTACRRFSLCEQYLELVWVCNVDEVRSDATKPTQLWERWSGRNGSACPVGLVFRALPDGPRNPPFRAWSYSPAYLPPGLSIEVAEETSLAGPAFFFLPFVTDRRGRPPIRLETETLTTITRVEVALPDVPLGSDANRWALANGVLSYEQSDHFCVTILLDGARMGRIADARPHLPLVLKW